MELSSCFSENRIIDITCNSFAEALSMLLDTCDLESVGIDKSELLSNLLEREKTMMSYIGSGVAVPHVCVNLPVPYVCAVGRCTTKIKYDGIDDDNDLQYIFLLLSSDREINYLRVLAELVRVVQNPMALDIFAKSKTIATFRKKVFSIFDGEKRRKRANSGSFNELFLRSADNIARLANCSSVMIFGGKFLDNDNLGDVFDGMKLISVADKSVLLGQSTIKNSTAVINVNSSATNWLGELRSAILIGLTRGVIGYDEKICCIGGSAQSDMLDTLFVIDVQKEFRSIFTSKTKLLPDNIRPEVLERVLEIASELAYEGREGKPVGCMFVVGDDAKLANFTKPLVMNPFYGYAEEDRNILNPFMDETIKEFSQIDGAFVIRGDGVIQSAGTLLHTPDHNIVMPSGFGTRHAAGAAISLAAGCLAIVVSESTHRVTLFQNGQMLPLSKKS